MITKKEQRYAQKRAAGILKKAGIAITKKEAENIEVVDHGFGFKNQLCAEILVYENNDIYCAKEIVLFPGQTVAEHRHPRVGAYKGKMETFRCRKGIVYLYIAGKSAKKIKAKVPEFRKEYFTAFREIILNPGEQYTLKPNTLHWFQAGPKGAIVSEFSSKSIDKTDVFTDPDIKRITVVK